MNALSLKPPRRGVFAAAFAAGAFVLVLLLPLSLEARAHRLLALFLAVIVLWVSEALPIAVTALLIPAGLVLLGITDQVTAFASFADPLLFLFVGPPYRRWHRAGAMGAGQRRPCAPGLRVRGRGALDVGQQHGVGSNPRPDPPRGWSE